MGMSDPLTSEEIDAGLAQLNGWELRDDALVKRFTFPNFTAAMSFMAKAAPAVDALNHHPEWSNVYNRVDVRLTTHDAGNRVTVDDITLARVLDRNAK
jgi:4a-hydroxytetrahydrobiopterin dehydratase